MWTIYQGKLKTDTFEESSPDKDEENFKSLVEDLYSKLQGIESKKTWFSINKHTGSLHIIDEDTCIIFTKKGSVIVQHPAA